MNVILKESIEYYHYLTFYIYASIMHPFTIVITQFVMEQKFLQS